MNDTQQLTTILSSAAVVAVLLALITNISNSFRAEMISLNDRLGIQIASFRSDVATSFVQVNARIDATNQRFDDMRDLWRAELHRVEDILDARLKHIEEERNR